MLLAIENILGWQDLIFSPIVLIVLYLMVWKQDKRLKGKPYRRYYLPAFWVRILGSFLSACMYQFYYGTGDTYGYYDGALVTFSSFWNDPLLFIEIYFTEAGEFSFRAFNYFHKQGWVYYLSQPNTLLLVKLGGLLCFVTFTSYLGIGFIIAYWTFKGCWKLFEVFYDQYPHNHKLIAIATLFIPSIFFWGAAGLLKDPIVIIALGYTVWGVYYLFHKRERRIRSIFYVVLGFYFLFVIKAYVAIALFPALVIWIFMLWKEKIKNKTVRRLAMPIFFILAGVGSIGMLQVIASNIEDRFSPDQILEFAAATQSWHAHQSQGNASGYDLGDYEMTPLGILKMVPKSINVALFRPYLWEMKKIILIPSALESLACLLITLYIFFRVGIWRTIKNIFAEPNVMFCLTFSLIFAFAVGFTSYNFGALVRYKIPCLQFYFLALFILLDQYNQTKKLKVKRRRMKNTKIDPKLG